MKLFFHIFLGLFLVSFGMALNYDVIANLYHQIKIMENSLQNSFNEHYITRCQLADTVRVPKWAPSKYKHLVERDKIKERR